MAIVDTRPPRSSFPARLLVGLVVVVASLVVVGVVVLMTGGPARGLDTTCGDFTQMSVAEQIEVIHESGRWKTNPSAGVAYYLGVCPQGNGDDQLKYFKG